jgi:DNA (cytosine-5)-methyltransferase 1
MSRPRLLDLFSCAGGAAKGYADAGFDVTGVDIDAQPNYPYAFVQGDALEYVAEHGHGYDAIHASPPCQGYLNLGAVNRKLGRTYDHPDLIAATRELLEQVAPSVWVIENVEDARAQLVEPVRICGTGLGRPIRRHRLFESNIPLEGVACDHGAFTQKRYWTGWRPGGETRLSTVVQIYGNAGGREHWPAALGVDWMTAKEMTECVPPAYTEHVGRQLIRHVRPCTLILHTTKGNCPSCGRDVLADGWNRSSRDNCYWCGYEGHIACTSACSCITAVAS